MAKWIKRIVVIFALLVVAFAVVGWFLPTEFKLTREIVINAEREKIHDFVEDLEKWDMWTPWSEADPTIVVTRGKQTKGVGAGQAWNGRSGDGMLTVTASSPQRGIEYDLFFDGGGFQCVSAMRYTSAGQGTTVTWMMSGDIDVPVIGGYFAALMDVWVGPMFERGLERLKAVAEGG
ncbi:MAG: SRPBCC family protein [Gammaproteobacteria bacterium]|nr:SRPBCC family protein [Gammaproteobacteria bacterium]